MNLITAKLAHALPGWGSLGIDDRFGRHFNFTMGIDNQLAMGAFDADKIDNVPEIILVGIGKGRSRFGGQAISQRTLVGKLSRR
jgi:hypothetical protein